MMGYLWIGLGGAFGSIGRAWLAVAVACLTGPQFSWGTILINILGSFVIGFFGTLTANDSRFSVPADVRAFVMIGLCGGFTTFSSFSLQTLDLARDGRMVQAMGKSAYRWRCASCPSQPGIIALPLFIGRYPDPLQQRLGAWAKSWWLC